MRCLTLANALGESGAEVTFVAAAMPEALGERIAAAGHRLARIASSPEMQRDGAKWEEPPLSTEAQRADAEATRRAAGQADWLIVDHYLLNARWHSAGRSFADQLLVIDDLANRPCDCDILLDQTYGRSAADYRELVPDGARILAGATYALLRPEFARERPAALDRRKVGGPVRRILVSMGIADPDGITARVAEQVLAAASECAIDVVAGAHAISLEHVRELAGGHSRILVHVDSEQMAELMRDADVAIGAAGMTSWERCCLGLPSIVLVLADNQRAGAEALAASDAALVTRHADEVSAELGRLLNDADAVARMSAAAFAISDGLGTSRVLGAMLDAEISGDILVRPATLADGGQLWLWRNDPVTRAQSRTSEPVNWEDHVKWLAARLDRPDGYLFIAERNGVPVGTVRFDQLRIGGHEVSIAVAPEQRSSGCGAAMLRAGCERIGPGAIYASVREDNGPSRRLFESCGFTEIESAESRFLRYLLVMNDRAAPKRNKR